MRGVVKVVGSTGWSERVASAKLKYSSIFFLPFVGMNLLVVTTYKQTGKVSFSSLLLLPFESFFEDLTGYTGSGVLVFAVTTFVLLWAAVSLIGTRMRILGWLLLLIIFASTLPIFDTRDIFIW